MEYGHFKRRDRGDFRDRDRRDNRDRGGFRGRERDSGGGDREYEESVFSKRVRAGRRRTYFFDVRKTRGEDFFITITESTRREDGYGYKRHKLFLYKEDFNRFVASLNEVVDHVKTELMPDFDYEEFDRRQAEWEAQNRENEDADEDWEMSEKAQAREQDEDAGHDDNDQEDNEQDDDDKDAPAPKKSPSKDEDEMSW